MKRLLISLVILMSAVSLSLAQDPIPEKGKQMGMMCKDRKSSMIGRMHPMMYSTLIHHALMKANSLDLTDVQRKGLAGIPERYIYPIIHKEADLKVSHMKIISMLHDPNFDPAKVKSETKVSNEIKLEMVKMSIDALSAIRNAIGVENFKKISEIKPIMDSKGR